MRLPIALLLTAAAAGTTAAAGADDAHRPPHPPSAAVAALRCGSATYKCAAAPGASADSVLAVPSSSVCVNLCIKGADPPKSPVPEGACGPPCTWPAEACVLAARAAAAAKARGGGGAESAEDDGGSVLPALPLTHADFVATYEGLRSSQACPLVVE